LGQKGSGKVSDAGGTSRVAAGMADEVLVAGVAAIGTGI
jgi:hypothetical protein